MRSQLIPGGTPYSTRPPVGPVWDSTGGEDGALGERVRDGRQAATDDGF